MVGSGDERGRGRRPSPGRGHGTPSPPGRGHGTPSPPGRVHGSPSPQGRGSYSTRQQKDLENEFAPPAPSLVSSHVPKFPVKPMLRPDGYEYVDALSLNLTNPPKPSPIKAIPSLTSGVDYPSIQESLGRSPRGSQLPTSEESTPPRTDTTGSPSNPSPLDPEAALKEKFKNLLNSYYKAMAEVNAKNEVEILEIDFDHLLTEEYMDLAIKITERAPNNPGHSWLQSTARDFLNAQFKRSSLKDQRRLGFRFIDLPKSIHPLSLFKTQDVVTKQSVYDGRHMIVRTTKTGRLVYLSVLTHVLTVHKKRKSYRGDFSEKEIYIVVYHGKSRFRCVILARRTGVSDSEFNAKILDLQAVHTILTPRYELDGEFPAYFPDLKEDIEGLTKKSMTETGILKVIPFHYSLMTPGAWGFIIGKVHLVIQQLRGNGTKFDTLFGKKLSNDVVDWRPPYRNSADLVVKGVYNHDNNKDDDKFSNNFLGMCSCNRHLVHHAHQHPEDDPVRVRDDDENELFAALKMPEVLPHLFRELFKGKEMLYKKELGRIYEDFCKLCYDVDEDMYEGTE